jgi:hypothetical protein
MYRKRAFKKIANCKCRKNCFFFFFFFFKSHAMWCNLVTSIVFGPWGTRQALWALCWLGNSIVFGSERPWGRWAQRRAE